MLTLVPFDMSEKYPLPEDVYRQPPVDCARLLLGTIVQVGDCSGRIVETEAYTGPPEDYASHAYTRNNSAGAIMETAGRIYIYSIHNGLALNITCHPREYGAVLIRAIEPISGLDWMIRRRSRRDTKISRTWNREKYASLRTLTNGPSKLCEALGIRREWNNTPVGERVQLLRGEKPSHIVTTSRIGISASQELPWRFCDVSSRFLSRQAL